MIVLNKVNMLKLTRFFKIGFKMNKKALISEITGQDGSYLTEQLINKGYEVHGIIRRSSSFNTFRIDHLYRDKKIIDKKLSSLQNH